MGQATTTTNKQTNKQKTGTNARNRHLTSVVHQTCKIHQNYGAVRMETINYMYECLDKCNGFCQGCPIRPMNTGRSGNIALTLCLLVSLADNLC